MYDYKYGESTYKLKLTPDQFLPKLNIKSPPNQALYLSLGFLHGIDILPVAQVCKSWYSTVWEPTLWNELSNNFKKENRMNALIELADSKIRLLEKEARRRINMTQYQDEEDLSSIVGAPAITDLSDRQKSGFKFRFVYAYLLFKTCYECSSPEQKLRFLPIKHFSLCHECSKLNKYDMINNETAELEYSVTKYDLNKHEIEGLKVPDPSKPGKSMLVYYLNDILHISRLKGDNNPKITSVQKRELEDKRKVEIMYLLKQENIDDRFIEQFIYNEGTPGNNYIQGKSRRSVNQIVATIKKKYLKALQRSEIDEEETVRLQEPEMIIPLKKPKLELDESQKNRRRAELTERISLMGIALHEVDMRDNDGIFMAYVNGRTKQELGQVAGAIWRDHKPVFTGIPFLTCQRKEDLKIDRNLKIDG